MLLIEETNGAGGLFQQYVYGIYIDEPLVLDRNLGGGETATGLGDQRLFYHQNTLYSVIALTNANGIIIEGLQYDAYGRQTVFGPGGNGIVDFGGDDVIATSAVDNPYMFSGRRLDPETGLYYYRHRYYAPQTGRFLVRDPIGIAGRAGLYAYVGSRPVSFVDPLGLQDPGQTRTREQQDKSEKKESPCRWVAGRKSEWMLLSSQIYYIPSWWEKIRFGDAYTNEEYFRHRGEVETSVTGRAPRLKRGPGTTMKARFEGGIKDAMTKRMMTEGAMMQVDVYQAYVAYRVVIEELECPVVFCTEDEEIVIWMPIERRFSYEFMEDVRFVETTFVFVPAAGSWEEKYPSLPDRFRTPAGRAAMSEWPPVPPALGRQSHIRGR